MGRSYEVLVIPTIISKHEIELCKQLTKTWCLETTIFNKEHWIQQGGMDTKK